MVRISVLHPDFTWHKTPTISQQEKRLQERSSTPKLRKIWPKWIRIIVGRMHGYLVPLSHNYCRWYDVQFSGQVCDLPFGLVLKRSDGTRLEEVVAMQAARDAGLPVPVVISYGEHPEAPHAPVSILMTRMPGETLYKELWEWYRPAEKRAFLAQLRSFLATIRSWKQDIQLPRARHDEHGNSICSVMGTNLRSVRVPHHSVGPCMDEIAFNEALSRCAYGEWTKQTLAKNYLKYLEQLHAFEKLPPSEIVFTHGDLAEHNLMVLPDGRISAVLDWEASGWYPEYWEYTTAVGMRPQDGWWPRLIAAAGGDMYKAHYEGDRARRILAPDTMGF